MNKRIVIFDKEQYDGEWFPDNALEFVAWFSEKIERIPEEYRDSAEVELDSVGGYEGSHYVSLEISYTRPETNDEVVARTVNEINNEEAQLARDERRYEELKEKLGK